MSRKSRENEVLKRALELDPKDQSPEAQQVRETAEDIMDHRQSEEWNDRE